MNLEQSMADVVRVAIVPVLAFAAGYTAELIQGRISWVQNSGPISRVLHVASRGCIGPKMLLALVVIDCLLIISMIADTVCGVLGALASCI